jgi:hypothetical protein
MRWYRRRADSIESEMGSASPLFAHEISRLWIHIRGHRALVSMKVIRMNAPTPMPASDMAAQPRNIAADMAMARALVQRLHAAGRRSTAELLHELRRAFPDAPLAVRVGALQTLPSL